VAVEFHSKGSLSCDIVNRCHVARQHKSRKIYFNKGLNEDLPSTLTSSQVAETRVSHDRPVDANMASREHYLQYGVRIID